ncbi:TIGR00730 family Rossman fold protein [Streptomyces sp. NPDC046805]|uniref:LOG family protein n=1 Tax=Streptomyces sp. NPDC046805 TaxID=3155134 RepID=UPI0033C238F5
MSTPRSLRRIGVFCGSRPGSEPGYLELARELGAALAARNIGLVYGGGCAGIMGAAAGAAQQAGGEVIGVTPQGLFEDELAEVPLGRLHVVPSMHERKALMYEFSDGFITLPGGLGTLEELLEISTWAQLGLHDKPSVVLNYSGVYDPLTQLLDGLTARGFLPHRHRRLVRMADTVDDAIAAVEAAYAGAVSYGRT